jgi:hypothetical protein
MSDSVRIPVERLRQVCTIVLDHLAQNENGVVELERDYFWTIDDETLYNVYVEPAELGVGQVSESWAHLKALLDGTDESPTRHLVWLAEVLRAAGTPETRKPMP